MSLREALELDFDALCRRELVPVEVAILDTGIDATHPDLTGRVVEAFDIDPVAEATLLTAIRQGAVALAKTAQSLNLLEIGMKAFGNYLDRLRPDNWDGGRLEH